MSKTSKMKVYEVEVYRPDQVKWKIKTIEAQSVSVDDGTLYFWVDTIIVASFPKDGWGSVIEK